ncbi:MAG: hypothetical protein L0G70_11940 [Rubrobacter sp.]|nr:hypothetical protein [Rubrobacter sp.]
MAELQRARKYSAATSPERPLAMARPVSPANSLRLRARLRWREVARSIFMFTVLDHASSWLIPSRIFARMICHQAVAAAEARPKL